MKPLTAVGLALVLMAGSACGGGDSSGIISAPTGTVVTDTFNGTVPLPVAGVLQVDVHPFNVAVAGTVSVTLVSAGPPPTITMGLGSTERRAPARFCRADRLSSGKFNWRS